MSKSREGYTGLLMPWWNGFPQPLLFQVRLLTKSAYDVAIVGSDFASLVAARDISRHVHANVPLIEARDRIGGRTWTANVMGEQLEMGRTWIQWHQPHVSSELHRYGLHKNLKTFSGTTAAVVQYYKTSDQPIRNLSVKEAVDICERVAIMIFQADGLDSRSLMPYPHDPFQKPATWSKYDHFLIKDRLNELNEIPLSEQDVFEMMTSPFGNTSGRDISPSVKHFDGMRLAVIICVKSSSSPAPTSLARGDMTSLAKSILADFKGNLFMNSPVNEVSQDSDSALIEMRDRAQYQAQVVIATIPLNCLGSVTFKPAICQLREEAIAQGRHINRGAKLHFKLSDIEPGWFTICDITSPYVFAFSDHNGTKASDPNETWFVALSYNDLLENKANSKTIVEQFKKNIRPPANVELYATHDWMNDPYAGVVWSY